MSTISSSVVVQSRLPFCPVRIGPQRLLAFSFDPINGSTHRSSGREIQIGLRGIDTTFRRGLRLLLLPECVSHL